MTEQITVPRATWDAMREALEEACGNRCNAEHNPCYAREALTAANAAQPQAQPRPLGWYMLTKDNLATLCADQSDAEQEAKCAQQYWPSNGPHRAAQLYEVKP